MAGVQEQTKRGLFREEALLAYLSSPGGTVVRLSRRWERTLLYVCAGLLTAALLFLALVDVREFASGTAVVRATNATPVATAAAGLVSAILVQPGQRVAKGQELLRLNQTTEEDDYARARKEFDIQLVRLLRDPRDDMARQLLASLFTARASAKSRLAERTLRAPRAGIVSGVRIHLGQHLAAGDNVLSIVDRDAPFTVLAILPGHHRPALKPGLMMRLELTGYRYAYFEVPIASVEDQVIGPGEVRRFLGPELADTMSIETSAVLANGHLAQRDFAFEGSSFNFYDGMSAKVEIPVRKERAATAFWPVLRSLGWR